ncbi:MAG: biotin--[acetyl-CoA-carboxylase] ligase [Phycisphaerae bacterium]|nr:biotin--[acetyl-CoA-carboxylase] ligase [Phycisphaerae bacterium]
MRTTKTADGNGGRYRGEMHGPLTHDELLPASPLQRLGSAVHILETIDSTNTHLASRVGELPDGTVAWAEFQTSGRGRHNRKWLAPRGSSIVLSVLLYEPPGSALIAGGTLLAALAVCEAIENATDCHANVRWPNDIVIDGRKLGGVLAESTSVPADTNGRRAVIIGIGLNCLQHRSHFPPELTESATSLEIESITPIRRARVAAALLRHLDGHVTPSNPSPARWRTLLSSWKARCDDLGARVELQQDARRVSGTVLDITEEGDLLVQLDEGGRRRFESATTTRLW